MSDLHLLPSNATQGERDVSIAIERHAALPVPVRDLWNADTCPAQLLPWLAWAYSVDVWDTNWSDVQKRLAIRASIEVHRRKGTIGAVQEALTALIDSARVQEWFNQTPEANPYTFKILIESDQTGASQEAIKSLLDVIDRTKNLRSHLDGVHLTVKTTAGPTVVTVAGIGSDICITNYVFSPLVVNETTICVSTPIIVFNETTICN